VTSPSGDAQAVPAAVLRQFFTSLDRTGVVAVALRFDESLLASNRELDLLVEPSGLRTVVAELVEVSRLCGADVAYIRYLPRHAATVILAWPEAYDTYASYWFDIRTSICKRGHVLLDGTRLREVARHQDARHGVRTLPNDIEVALLMLRNAFDMRTPSPRHTRIIGEANSVSVEGAVRWLGYEVEPSAESSQQTLDLDAIRVRSRLRWFVRVTRHASRALIGRLGASHLGASVAIYGPDGVGKSTQAELLGEFLRGLRVHRVRVYHYFREVDPDNRGRRSTWGTRRASTKKRLYRESRPGGLVLILVLSYVRKLLQAHLIFGHYRRQGYVLVHDRFLLDVLQKAFTSTSSRFLWLERLFGLTESGSDLRLLLVADPGDIVARSDELNLDEIRESYAIYRSSLLGGRRAATEAIEAVGPADSVQADIRQRFLSSQAARAARRFKVNERSGSEPKSA
jgi:thymidylate kinase